MVGMTKDDQRVRETVQAELKRRRGAMDKGEDRAGQGRGDGACSPKDQSRQHLADRR